jgi:hypothetical protein
MVLLLRGCVFGYVSCEVGEICLLNQIHKQRTPTPNEEPPALIGEVIGKTGP